MTEMKIYLDTNIYIDLFEDRTSNFKPLGEFAHQILKRTFSCEFKIIASPLILDELKNNKHLEHGTDLLADLEKANKLEFVNISYNDKKTASMPKEGSHYADRLHYIIAEKANADFFITGNWRDFYGLGKIQVLQSEYL
ncbi:MAG: type II toxin-antitoxin system VapC family toxin [Candidatus Woesearchaeota archaeon]